MSEIEITTPDPKDLGVGPYLGDEIKEDLPTLPGIPQEGDGDEEDFFIPLRSSASNRLRLLYVKTNSSKDQEEEGYDPTKFYQWPDNPEVNIQLNHDLQRSNEANEDLDDQLHRWIEEVE